MIALDWLGPWQGAALAVTVALAWGGLAGGFRWSGLASAAAGVGIAAGWVLVLGTLTASPRQLPERLPLLAIAMAAAGALLAPAGRAAWVWAVVVLMAAGGAWWLAGMPLFALDLRRAALPLLALVLLAGLLLLALDGPLPAAIAALGASIGLVVTAPFGPWLPLGAALAAAAVGGLAGGRDWPPAARLAPALGLCALAAGPVLARGAPADWLVAAIAPAALWLGPALGARFGGRLGPPLGWGLAIGVPLGLAWLARTG